MYTIALCKLYALMCSVWLVRLLKGCGLGSLNWIKSSLFMFMHLFIYLHLRYKVCTYPVNQLPIVQPSSFTRTQKIILETNTHFTPELLICALDDLTTCNLAYIAHLLECQCPTLVVTMKIFLLVYFLSWVECLLVLPVALNCMLHYEYFKFPTPFRDQLNRLYFPLLAAHRVSDSKISGANPSSLSLKVSWMNVYSEIYDGWLRTAGNWGIAIILLN
jgi:hypothetical protein